MLDEKAALRSLARDRRREAHARWGDEAAHALARHGLDFLRPAAAADISGFSSIRDEMSLAPLLDKLHGQGFGLALPAMQGKGKPLVFRRWAPGDEMAEAVWGIAEPKVTAPAVEPDIVLVPLLAFDNHGFRLGYGGGFYDRSLARLRAMKPIIAVGIGYDEQRVDAVPHADYDERLDWVLTPSGPSRCAGA